MLYTIDDLIIELVESRHLAVQDREEILGCAQTNTGGEPLRRLVLIGQGQDHIAAVLKHGVDLSEEDPRLTDGVQEVHRRDEAKFFCRKRRV